jgi:hypothetical protein
MNRNCKIIILGVPIMGFRRIGERVWIGFIWLRIGTGGGLL